ncbi:MAG: sugar ABC transporter substrate-binding protein [Intestinibacillus sp.]
MKKRTIALALTSFMCLGLLSGCSQPDNGQESASSGEEAASGSSNSSKVIAFVPKTLNNPFFVAIKDNVEAACKENGWIVKVNAADAETEVDKQISILEAYIEEGVDAIITGPSSKTALVDVINKADEKGIPVLLVDSGADECAYQAYVGTDNYVGGQQGAKWIGEHVKEGEVAILDGFSGNDATTQRQKGFMDEIANYPDIKVVASEYGNCEISKGMEVTENFLTAYPNLKGIFAVNDMMAIGAGQAVEAAAKRGQIQICGFDGQPDAAQKIIEGTIDATIAQKPATMGKMIVQSVKDYFDGKEIERNVDTGCDVVNKDNAEEYLKWH